MGAFAMSATNPSCSSKEPLLPATISAHQQQQDEVKTREPLQQPVRLPWPLQRSLDLALAR
jgi:hypothetical protein